MKMKQKKYLIQLKNLNNQENKSKNKIDFPSDKKPKNKLNERRIRNSDRIFTKWISFGEENDADSAGYWRKQFYPLRTCP